MPRDNKPDDWIYLLLKRFQLQLPSEAGISQPVNNESAKHIRECVVNISEHKFNMVVSGLARLIKDPTFLYAVSAEKLQLASRSNIVILDTIAKCFDKFPEQCAALPDEVLQHKLLPNICQFVTHSSGIPLEAEQKSLAAKILWYISGHHFSALFNHIAMKLQALGVPDDNSDTGDLELIKHLNVNSSSLKILLQESVGVFKSLKKPGQLALVSGLDKAIWNWVENSPKEFAELQKQPSKELSGFAERLFDLLDQFAESSKRKAAVWPLQTMLLILCPELLQEIATSDKVSSSKKAIKKEFLEHLKKTLTSTKTLTESAAVSCVKLCKAATYMKPEDNSVLCFLVLTILNELKALLFNVSKPFTLGTNSATSAEELMVGCYVSSFRINFRNNQHFDVCLLPSSPIVFNLAYVRGTYAVVTENPLAWWPRSDVLHPKAPQLRVIFLNVLNRILSSEQDAQQSRLSQIYKQKLDKKHKEDELHSVNKKDKDLLLWLVKLFHAEPIFAFHNSEGTPAWEVQKSSMAIIKGLVNLVLCTSVSQDIRQEAAQTLHCLFQADNMEMWNPASPIASSWEISSQVLLLLSDELVNHGNQSTVLLRYLKEILCCRNEFLRRHKDQASVGSHLPICASAQTKLEEVLLTYLWSYDMEPVMLALSCFGHLCEEVDIVQSSESLNELHSSSNFAVYSELSAEAGKFNTGRAALQKRVMVLLRQLDRQTPGNVQAWESTYARWQKLTSFLVNYSKDEISSLDLQKYLRRRTNSQNAPGKIPSDDLESNATEWVYMTGFLCSLGGVCLNTYQTLRRFSRVTTIQTQYSPSSDAQKFDSFSVTRFMSDLLNLLVCSNEKFGAQIRATVNELVGLQLSPNLYPILITGIKTVLSKFFKQTGQVVVQDVNTLFVEQVIVIMRLLLENRGDGNTENVPITGMTGIDSMITSLVRYVNNLPLSLQALQIKTRLCILVDVAMSRRQELVFHQEFRFRNKLLEYLTDWIMHSTEEEKHIPLDLTVRSNELDDAAMRAIASLLVGLPLQTEGLEADIVDAKSQLFLKYFTLFMNLMSRSSDLDSVDRRTSHRGALSQTQKLNQSAVQAMSNLLNANIDTGLMYAIGLGYHDDLQTRAVFMEVLTKILQQGTEFDNLADTVLMDRFDRLADLVTLKGDRGELPITLALASVTPSQQLDELAQVLVNLFDDKHILPQLLKNIFAMEVRSVEGMQTLFRGNSLASKTMTFCYKIYGGNYIRSLLEPLIAPMFKANVSYEVDPERLPRGENIEENRNNLIKVAQSFLSRILESAENFPVQLRSLCGCLRKVVHHKFPKNTIEAVGSVVFLRFINPAITSPHVTGIVDQQPPGKLRRGLMLLSKVLQSLANHVLFTKEKHMEPFNGFLQTNFEKMKRFIEDVSSECELPSNDEPGYSFISNSSAMTVYKMLWNHQEKIGTYLASRREYKSLGRGAFEKMSTLLAHLGPPDQQKFVADRKWRFQDQSRFEEFMARHAEESQDELQTLKNLNVFYQGGRSKAGNPIFYFISRRFKADQINDELLIYHALLTIERCHELPWELILDFTHTSSENRFNFLEMYLKVHSLLEDCLFTSPGTLVKLMQVVPEITLRNLDHLYLYNCGSSLRQYAKYHERLLAPLKGLPKVRIADSLSKLHDYIEPEELQLPTSTLSLEEDLKVFKAVKFTTRQSILVKIGPMSVQLTTPDKHKILGYSTALNDVFYANEVLDAYAEDEYMVRLKLVNTGQGMLLMTNSINECEQMIQAVHHVKKRWQLSQPDSATTASKKIRPKDVPGTLLNMALLNLGTRDPSLRLSAYNLLCSVTKSFNLKIEERLLEGTGLCIPANNTIFIVGISEKLASREPQLTLEFLEECITGFTKSDYELKHLCLEYMAPWLPNLSRFSQYPPNDPQKIKMSRILEDLINLTVAEKGMMYPSIQANIWGNIGKVTDLLDTVLDSFIKASATGGFGSQKAETMADTAVTLATANVQVVSSRMIGRLHTLIMKTSISPTLRLEQHLMWDDIAILVRYLLMLSFNDCLDVATHLPYLFYIVSVLVSTGPPSIRASIHGMVINIIQSLCTCTSIKFSEETHKLLRMRLQDLSSPKFYLLFGISKLKTPAVKAFKATCRNTRYTVKDSEAGHITMTAVETITQLLLEIMESCMKDMPDCSWLKTWTELTKEFAFKFNPALQPRSIVVLGCISKEANDLLVQQVLQVLIIALCNYTDMVLIEAVVICLTRLQSFLSKDSKFHKVFFWIAVAVLQLSEVSLYPAGLSLLEQGLLTLDSQGAFDLQKSHKVLMTLRYDPILSFHFKQMDHFVGLSFYNNFHFALMAHLMKGVYHPSASTSARAIRILNLMVNITSKHKHIRDKFAVTKENVAYLTALLPVSEEIRRRLSPGPDALPESESPTDGTVPFKLDSSPGSRTNSMLLERPVSIVITPSVSPNPCLEDSPVSESEAFVWPAECQHTLLDPGVVNDLQTQALLLTALAMLLEHTKGDVEVRFLYDVLAEASIIFPKVFPVIYPLLDPHLCIVLGHWDDVATLKSVHTIVQSMTAAKNTDEQLKPNFLSSFNFSGFSNFTKFKEQSGQNNRAQLFMKFLEAILEVFGGTGDDSPQRSLSFINVKGAIAARAQRSSSSDDLSVGCSSASSSTLSSSLTSLSGVVGKDTLPFKRSGSSYVPKKLAAKVKRNLSVRSTRSRVRDR